MDDLSSSGNAFDSLSSFCRSFSRRSRPQAAIQSGVASFAQYAPLIVSSEIVENHRTLAIEQTEAAIDHFLELSQRLTEAMRRHEAHKERNEGAGHFTQSRLALEEGRAWERWIQVFQSALRNAEAEIVLALRAWEEAKRPSERSQGIESGVIYKRHLYLAVPEGETGQYRLLVADLGASLNLDKSLAVVDVVR